MNEIKINLKFKDYKICKVKPFSNTAIIYPKKEWIGKRVCAIPLPYTISEKIIERGKNEEDIYELTLQTDAIIPKIVKDGSNVGRCYINQEFVGAEMLIIEAPIIEYY